MALFVPITLLLFASGPQTSIALPRFRDYAVKHVYRGKTAPINRSNYAGNPELYRVLKQWEIGHIPGKWDPEDAIKEPVNFAGHYILWVGSCGGSCAEIIAIDAKTGFVYPSPIDFHQTLVYLTREWNSEGAAA